MRLSGTEVGEASCIASIQTQRLPLHPNRQSARSANLGNKVCFDPLIPIRNLTAHCPATMVFTTHRPASLTVTD